MRWSSGAVSLLGRACDLNTGKKTYGPLLLRQLRELSVTHLRQLWSRRNDANSETTLRLGD